MKDKKRTIGQQRERERKRESFLLPRTRRTQHKFKFRALIKKIAFILFCGDWTEISLSWLRKISLLFFLFFRSCCSSRWSHLPTQRSSFCWSQMALSSFGLRSHKKSWQKLRWHPQTWRTGEASSRRKRGRRTPFMVVPTNDQVSWACQEGRPALDRPNPLRVRDQQKTRFIRGWLAFRGNCNSSIVTLSRWSPQWWIFVVLIVHRLMAF